MRNLFYSFQIICMIFCIGKLIIVKIYVMASVCFWKTKKQCIFALWRYCRLYFSLKILAFNFLFWNDFRYTEDFHKYSGMSCMFFNQFLLVLASYIIQSMVIKIKKSPLLQYCLWNYRLTGISFVFCLFRSPTWDVPHWT